jgi:hypothetical protein
VLVVAATLLASCGGSSHSSSSAAGGSTPASLAGGRTASWGQLPTGRGDPSATSSGAVKFTSQTVVVSPDEVRRSLIQVSSDGSTYTFADDSGPLGQLAPGKVMLLESLDAANVTKVTHSGKTLVVATSPATMGDLIQSGSIHVHAAPDVQDAFASEVGNETSGTTSSQQISGNVPGHPILAVSLANHTFKRTGKSGNFDYSLAFTGKSDGVHITGTFCYSLNKGPVSVSCGSLLSIKGDLDGVVDYTDETGSLSFSHGIPSGSMSLSNLSGELTIKYSALRGNEPNINADPPVFKLPYSFEMPLCPPPTFCDGVPLYTKVELSLLVKLGIASKGALIQGGVTVKLNGNASVSDGSAGVSGSSSGFHISGQFLPGPVLTAFSSAVLVAVQTKIGLGLGVKSFNAAFYLSFVAAVGQETPSADVSLVSPGQLCENYSGDFTISGNAEAQLFKKTIGLLPAKKLYEKKASYKQPGC